VIFKDFNRNLLIRISEIVPQEYQENVNNIALSESNLCILRLDKMLGCFGSFLDPRLNGNHAFIDFDNIDYHTK